MWTGNYIAIPAALGVFAPVDGIIPTGVGGKGVFAAVTPFIQAEWKLIRTRPGFPDNLLVRLAGWTGTWCQVRLFSDLASAVAVCLGAAVVVASYRMWSDFGTSGCKHSFIRHRSLN